MPAHKRSWSDSVNGEESGDQQFSHQDAKQSRMEREPKTETEEEEEVEEEEQREHLKEGEREDEGREEDEGEEEKQHNQLEEAAGARGCVTSIPFSFFLDFLRLFVLVPILRFSLWFLLRLSFSESIPCVFQIPKEVNPRALKRNRSTFS